MKDRQLRRLTKIELLELLKAQKEENEDLREENEELKAKLAEREILKEKAGSIAEAALQINEVFEAAQRAADQYLENVKRMTAGEQES